MKMRVFAVCVVIFLVCGITPSCQKSSMTNDLKELGFYSVASGKAQYISFKEYNDVGSLRGLPVTDFPVIPTLRQGDYFLLYGDMPKGPMDTGSEVSSYKLNGDVYKYSQAGCSTESFFSMEPMEPVRGNKCTKLTPKPPISKGTYFLHKHVGGSGGAYLGFHIE